MNPTFNRTGAVKDKPKSGCRKIASPEHKSLDVCVIFVNFFYLTRWNIYSIDDNVISKQCKHIKNLGLKDMTFMEQKVKYFSNVLENELVDSKKWNGQ